MNVLSLFDGISAGRLALQRAELEVTRYYRSEIDKYASQVAMHHFPNDIQLGDVTKWREWDIDWPSIDLLIGGSPCQGFSFAGKQAGTKANLNGVEILVTDRQTYLKLKEEGAEFLSQSHLFWEYVLILDHIKKHNPNVKFLLENVRMKKELLDMISNALGVKDIVINSSLVSAQNRHRHYWCNWEVTQPQDKGILLKDIIENDYVDRDKSYCIDANYYKGGNLDQYFNKSRRQLVFGGAIRGRYIVNGKRQDHKVKTAGLTEQRLEVRNDEKTNTLTTVQKDNVVVYRPASIVGRRLNDNGVRDDYNKNVPFTQCLQVKHKNDKMGCLTTVEKDTILSTAEAGRYPDIYNRDDIQYRKLTPLECERLQTFPDNWTDCVSNTQRYKSLGNAWTIDVIAHILKCVF